MNVDIASPGPARFPLTRFMPGTIVFLTLIQAFAPALAQDTHSASVQDALEQAAAFLQDERPHDALSALEVVERLEPQNPWAGYFRGIAHLKLGEMHAALEQYDRALQELASLGDPDPQLDERIRKDRRRVRRRIFDISVRAGLAFDSNVTFRGGGVSEFISGRDDAKFATQLRWDYSPVITTDHAFTIGGHLDNAWHFAIEQFDYQDYEVYFRYARRLSASWVWNVRYDYDISYLGNEPFLSSHAFSPGVTYRWAETGGRVRLLKTALHYQIEHRDFLFDTEPQFDRDGVSHSFVLEQSFRLQSPFAKNRKWDAAAGYRFESVATEGSEFDRFSNDFFLSLVVPLESPFLPGRDLTARFLALWELDNYRRRSLIDRRNRARDDLIMTFGLVLSQQLVDDVDRGELILHAILSWTDADSNVRGEDFSTPFDYDKLLAGFQIEWRF